MKAAPLFAAALLLLSTHTAAQPVTPFDVTIVAVQPSGAVIWEGDSLWLSVTVVDSTNTLRPDWAALARWRSFGGSPHNRGLIDTIGDTARFVGTRGNEQYGVAATVCVPPDTPGWCRSDTVAVQVLRAQLTGLSVQASGQTLAAGDTLRLTAAVYDNYHDSQREVTNRYGRLVQWQLVVDPDSGDHLGDDNLSSATGASTMFYAERAYNCYLAIATVADTNNVTLMFRDTARICVVPGPACCLWIEADTVITSAELREPNPVSLLTLGVNFNSATLVSVVRDLYGNFVRLGSSSATAWHSSNTSVVSVSSSSGVAHVGLVTRATVTSGTCTVTATEGTLQSDSVLVSVQSQAVIVSPIFVDGSGAPVGAVNISSDDSLALRLRVRLASGDVVDWAGAWSLSTSTLSYDGLDPPDYGSSWVFRPRGPGTGQICVSMDTLQHCIPVTVTRAPPRRMEMTLLTPDSLRVAGQPIQIEMRIYNLDGLVPGAYCFNDDSTGRAKYADPLRAPVAVRQPFPMVMSDGDSACVNEFFTGSCSLSQCFENGRDTIAVVLYYAPSNAQPHTLYGQLGSLAAYTNPFLVLPAQLDHLDLTTGQSTTVRVPDTVTLGEDDYQMFWAQGYDRYGNWRGVEHAVWTSTGALIPPPGNIAPNCYIIAAAYSSNAQGELIARSATDSTLIAQRHVVIEGSDPRIMQAVTQDRDANGYLDAIVITLNHPADLSAVDPSELAVGFDVWEWSHGSQEWTVAGVAGANGTMHDSVFTLTLQEIHSVQPQTAWLPLVNPSAVPGLASNPDPQTAFYQDGAGPVIWEAIEVVPESGLAEGSLVKAIFSEDVQGAGTALSWFTRPESLFVMYAFDSVGEFVPLPNKLTSIEQLSRLSDTTLNGATLAMIEFRMTNGEYVPVASAMGIRTEPRAVITDGADEPNLPSALNQPVRFTFVGSKTDPTLPPTNTTDNDTSSDCGSCGTGVEQAAFPLLILRLSTAIRRRRKRKIRGGP
jgi:hypothetical protein